MKRRRNKKRDAYRHEGFPNAVLAALPTHTNADASPMVVCKAPILMKHHNPFLPPPKNIHQAHANSWSSSLCHTYTLSLSHRISMLGKTRLLNRSTWNS